MDMSPSQLEPEFVVYRYSNTFPNFGTSRGNMYISHLSQGCYRLILSDNAAYMHWSSGWPRWWFLCVYHKYCGARRVVSCARSAWVSPTVCSHFFLCGCIFYPEALRGPTVKSEIYKTCYFPNGSSGNINTTNGPHQYCTAPILTLDKNLIIVTYF